jgi:hypothetical protein
VHGSRGVSLVEALAVLTVIALATAVAVPSVAELRSSVRMSAASRELALTLRALRWKSVAEHAARGLLFELDAEGWRWLEVRDGNANGLRTSEVHDGTDPIVSGPHRLEDRVAGVSPGFPSAGPFPVIPPDTGWIADLGDPVKFGSTNLISFRPLGTASSGSIYLTDGGDQLWAIVLFGPSARVRVWRFDPGTGRWRR